MLVDAHVHLNSKSYKQDLDKIIKNSAPTHYNDSNRYNNQGVELKTNLPLIIHCRNAFNLVVQIIESAISKQQSPLRGVFHCYTGTKRVKEIDALEFYFGVNGLLTYDQGLKIYLI